MDLLRAGLVKQKSPRVLRRPVVCLRCRTRTLLHARLEPPPVITEEDEVIGRAKPIAGHGGKVELGIGKVKRNETATEDYLLGAVGVPADGCGLYLN